MAEFKDEHAVTKVISTEILESPKHTPNFDRFSENTMSGANVLVAFQKLLPKNLSPGLSTRPANLYQVLSRYAVDGVGQRVHQTRWTSKGISDCYWVVTRTSLKKGSTHGKAWGRLVWRGQFTDYFLMSCGARRADYVCLE